MKKTISFEKKLTFSSMIGQINSISLDQDIKFINPTQAIGNLVISGNYKMTEASTILEDFSYELPVEINLTETIDIESGKISISDFRYEIEGDDVLSCNIDLIVEGIETIDLEEENKKETITNEEIIKVENKTTDKDERECDGDTIKEINEIDLPKAEIKDNNISKDNEKKQDNNDNVNKSKEEKKQDSDDNINKSKEEKNTNNNIEINEENENTNISSLFQAFENSKETFKTYSVYIMRKDDTLEKILDKYKISIDSLEEYNDLSNIEVGSKIIIPSANE